MKVKIEDFLLAMGNYCREHSPEECASCKMSVDHEDPGDGTVFMDALCLDASIQNMPRW